jgi:hypothetical protein
VWPGVADGGNVSVNSIGPNTAALALTLVTTPDPQTRQAQVNAQADLLQAVRGVDLPTKMALAKLSDNKGIDIYL